MLMTQNRDSIFINIHRGWHENKMCGNLLNLFFIKPDKLNLEILIKQSKYRWETSCKLAYSNFYKMHFFFLGSCFRRSKHFFRDKSSFHSRSEPNVKTDSILVYSRCDNSDTAAHPAFPATIQEKPEQDLYANDEDENRYSDIPGDLYSNTQSPNSGFPKTFKGLEINVSHLADEQRNKKQHVGGGLLEMERRVNSSDNATYSHLNHSGNFSQTKGSPENVYGEESVTDLN